MSRPTIAALIFAYNHEDWIRGAIQSVLDQEDPVEQILFSADGSTDSTLAIAKDCLSRHSNVTFLPQNEKNLGFTWRYAQAHSLVTADCVMTQSGDDLWLPNAVRVHRKLMSKPDVEWSVAAYEARSQDFSQILSVLDPIEIVDRWGDAYKAIMLGMVSLGLPASCYRMSLYRRVGGIDPSLPLEDLPLLLRFVKSTVPALSHEVVRWYRQHPVSLSHGPRRFAIRRAAIKICLQEVGFRPSVALRTSSERCFSYALDSMQAGRRTDAIVAMALASALWPSPVLSAKRIGSVLLRGNPLHTQV